MRLPTRRENDEELNSLIATNQSKQQTDEPIPPAEHDRSPCRSLCGVLMATLFIATAFGTLGFVGWTRWQSMDSISVSIVSKDQNEETTTGSILPKSHQNNTTKDQKQNKEAAIGAIFIKPHQTTNTTLAVTKNQNKANKTIAGAMTNQTNTTMDLTSITLSPIKQKQVDNFRNDNGLLLNFHVVHHGGTAFCAQIGRRLKAPTFACMGPKPEDKVGDDYPLDFPWAFNDTDSNIQNVRQYFNMISWEFLKPPPQRKPQIPETNWHHPQLVSVIVMRDPISRMLAGDGFVHNNWPFLELNGTLEQWWEFANADKHTDNYALRVLAGNDCCNGTHTDRRHLERAQEMVQQFTFVLDIECLDAGMQKLGRILGIDMEVPVQKSKHSHQHKSSRERIGFTEVYEYLLDKNKLDIELYQWSKNLSLVNCAELKSTKATGAVEHNRSP